MLTVIACGSSSGPEDTRDEALEEYLTGLDLQDRGNLSAAFDAYNKALRLDPRLDQAYAARGHIYYLYNDLNRAVDLNSEHAVAYYYRGLVFDAGEFPDDPILNFTKAIQLDPELGDAYFQRARLYFQEEDYDGAIDDLSAAINLKPRSPALRITRAQVYVVVGDSTRAIADLEEVLSLTEDESLVIPAKQMLDALR